MSYESLFGPKTVLEGHQTTCSPCGWNTVKEITGQLKFVYSLNSAKKHQLLSIIEVVLSWKFDKCWKFVTDSKFSQDNTPWTRNTFTRYLKKKNICRFF